jgi:predicted transcriptional regulator
MNKCEQIQDKLIDFLDQSLSEQEMKDMQELIDNNEECAQEVEAMRKLFFDMSEEEMEQPSAALRLNFEEMLEAEKAGTEQAPKVIPLQQERRSWTSYLRVAASILIVASAFVIGTLVGGDNIKNSPVDQVLASIENESASQRIAALNQSEAIQTTDRRVLQAFIDRLLYDEKTSVRLAAVEALTKFASEEMVKVALLKALEKDTDPAVQIELIQTLTKIEEKRALTPMKDLLNKEEVPEYVKKEIQYNIYSLEKS